jgi:hypothetical protein
MPISSKSSRVSSPNLKIQDVPNIPTVGTPSINTDGITSGTALNSVSVPVNKNNFGGYPSRYRVISNPGNIEGIGSSPVIVSGLEDNISYTFTARGESAQGAVSGYSAASSPINTRFGAMVPLASVTGFSGASAQVVMSNIPQIYQDLMVVYSLRTTWSAFFTSISVILNGDFSTLYSNTEILANGSTTSTGRVSNINYGVSSNHAAVGASAATGIFSAGTLQILDYTNTSKFKTGIFKSAVDGGTSGGVSASIGLYRSTAAINSIMIQTNGNYVAGSTFTLYGIKAVGQ